MQSGTERWRRNSMSPRRDSGELALPIPDIATMMVQGGPLADFMSAAANAAPREVLAAATRGITGLLGERGSCILLEGRPRVVLALHRPSLHDLPIDLDRYPEIRAAVASRDLVAVEDVRVDAQLAPVRDRLPADLRAVVAVPLVVGERCLGVVLVQSVRAHRPDDSARATAVLLARL